MDDNKLLTELVVSQKTPRGTQRVRKGAPRWRPKTIQSEVPDGVPKMHWKWKSKVPKFSPRAPKRDPKRSQNEPLRDPKRGPKWVPQNDPKMEI